MPLDIARLAVAASLQQFHPGPAGVESVRGEIIGPVSAYYSATLQTVEHWPRHGYRHAYPAKVHTFTAEEGTTGPAALAAYCARNRRDSLLGDGSPCIVTLEPVKQATP